MRHSRFPIALVVLAGLGCSACGASDSSSGGPAPNTATATVPDPCALIATSTAQAALGEAVGAATKSDIPMVNGCHWNATSTSAASDVVIIDISDVATFNAAEDPSNQGSSTIDKAPGLGDDAYYQTIGSASTGTSTTLEVRKGATVLGVDVEKSGASSRTAEHQVAAAALGNLP